MIRVLAWSYFFGPYFGMLLLCADVGVPVRAVYCQDIFKAGLSAFHPKHGRTKLLGRDAR